MELWIRRTQRLFPPECFENTFFAVQSTFRSLESMLSDALKFVATMLYTGFSVSKLQGLELLFTENF